MLCWKANVGASDSSGLSWARTCIQLLIRHQGAPTTKTILPCSITQKPGHMSGHSETRKEQERTPLESRYGSFRFVWPFMGHSTQRLVIDWTPRGLNVGGSAMAMAMAMELETSNKHDQLAFVWPIFQTACSHPSPQSVVVPTTYPFLQICKFSSLSLFPIPPLHPST